jgi:hypothetical protein
MVDILIMKHFMLDATNKHLPRRFEPALNEKPLELVAEFRHLETQ